jgi:hypothetical protein
VAENPFLKYDDYYEVGQRPTLVGKWLARNGETVVITKDFTGYRGDNDFSYDSFGDAYVAGSQRMRDHDLVERLSARAGAMK